ncbi:hypothetical protein A0H81_06165 [Grifola frondosa]|uniref:RING-type domain-containing protein n=1 Tax=Grifola frondosa TaxID=5627 RepID=A0A1C7MB59_GRIFR|nr:hypothetical protein A0H81_06165 [Grifola frondosa]
MITRSSSVRRGRSKTAGVQRGSGTQKPSRSGLAAASIRSKPQETRKARSRSVVVVEVERRTKTRPAADPPKTNVRKRASSAPTKKPIASSPARKTRSIARKSIGDSSPPARTTSRKPTTRGSAAKSSSQLKSRVKQSDLLEMKIVWSRSSASAISSGGGFELPEVAAQSNSRLHKRQRTLVKKEQELSRKEEHLEKQELALQKRMKETDDLAVSLVLNRAEDALAQLEEQFTCALCFDVMACPYTLIPSQCGHTYCALCILKWMFSHVHRDCGYWHEALECPLCRTRLPFAAEQIPRSRFTCPLTANRLADKIVNDLIKVLREEPKVASSSEGKKDKTALEDDGMIATWRDGGTSRREWEQRDRRGREEATFLANNWAVLNADEFIAMKDRLGM